MDRCSECGGKELGTGEHPITLEVGERTFEGTCEGWRCAACGTIYYVGGGLEAFEHLAAAWLAEHGVRTREELKFMRKAVGLRAADLAALLGVTPETVSHWETGKHTPDVAVRATIAALALEAVQQRTTTLDRLRAHGKPDALRKVRLEATPPAFRPYPDLTEAPRSRVTVLRDGASRAHVPAADLSRLHLADAPRAVQQLISAGNTKEAHRVLEWLRQRLEERER